MTLGHCKISPTDNIYQTSFLAALKLFDVYAVALLKKIVLYRIWVAPILMELPVVICFDLKPYVMRR